MSLADDIVKFMLLLWFFPAFMAGFALIFDQFLVPFIPKLQNKLTFLSNPNSRTILRFYNF